MRHKTLRGEYIECWNIEFLNLFSCHNGIKLEIDNNNISGKYQTLEN